ncbi:MAG TPA: glycerophosphodiester phosphodiesterase [Ramlibacter sp.]|nr:glycerophosphodiester phosphodiesterase [Ramlibacter sp.]
MHSAFRRPLVALLGALLSCSVLAFDLQGHRGARGLAPENTLAAFAQALDLGVTTLELDIGLSADGVVVVSHDPALNPAITRDVAGSWLPGRGPLLKSLTFAELQAFDVGRIDPASPYARTFATQQPRDGTRIPTLAQVFALVRARGAPVRFNIETKLSPLQPEETAGVEAMTDALLAAIRAAGMQDRVTIQSFDWRTLQRVQQLQPGLPTSYLTIQTANTDNVNDPRWTAGLSLADHGSVPRLVKAAGGASWAPNGGALTEALVKEAQALGLKVTPWTINAPADMERFIAWGVDGIITDYPDRLREVMQRRGLPLPAPAPTR